MKHPAARVAIVGAGPAGFYAAEALLKASDPVEIDIINRLPAPYGLVRDGVAPDHQAIKSVARVYSRLLARDEVRYFGNVTLGGDVTVDDLRARYDQIVYAVGAQSDRRLGIPGEELDGSHAAFNFVGWYNSHPGFRDARFDLDCEDVVVIGNGNVAIDVARILVLSLDRLATTDIADHALAALRGSRVRRVTLLGRRGPAQASFTNPELREFGRLDGVGAEVDAAELEIDPVSEASLEGNAVKTRNMNTLRGYASAVPEDGDRVVRFRFLVSPLEVVGERAAGSPECGSRGTAWSSRRTATCAPWGPARPKSCRAGWSFAPWATAAHRSRACPSRSGAGSCRTRVAGWSARGTAARSCRASTWWGGRSGGLRG